MHAYALGSPQWAQNGRIVTSFLERLSPAGILLAKPGTMKTNPTNARRAASSRGDFCGVCWATNAHEARLTIPQQARVVLSQADAAGVDPGEV